MKNRSILLTALILATTGIWAQQQARAPQAAQTSEPRVECRAVANEAAMAYEQSVDRTAYWQRINDLVNRGGARTIVPYTIQFHIVRMDDGTGGVDIDDVRSEFDNYVNPYYADVDIEFVECSPPIYHNSTTYYSLSGDAEGDAMSAAWNVPNVINMYFVGDPDGACGWARFPWDLPIDYIVIANGCADNQSTTAHELGHYFGLYHPHETALGDESVTRDNSDPCYDCDVDGDLLCDTPADPTLTGLVTNACVYTGSGVDACNGDTYVPDPTLIMSYSQKHCRTVFTPQSIARMNDFKDEREYLQNECPCDKPTASCKNITVYLGPDGEVTISPSDVDNGSFIDGDCGEGSMEVDPDEFDCSDIGPNTVTLTVTDGLGWTASCDATVTVADNTPPTITNEADDMTVECGPGNESAFEAWLADNGGATATDECGSVTWSNNSTGLSDGCGNTGSETVTFTATDGSGNSSTTAATFTIEDNTPPSVTCPADIHLPECVPTATWTVGSADACGEVTVVSDPPSGSEFPKGTTTTVNVTATDACGNVSYCSFEVERDPDLQVETAPLATSILKTCALGTDAHIVLGYGGGPSCVSLSAAASGGHAPYTYSWAAPAEVPAESFTNENTANPTFCAGFQTAPCVKYTFVVTATDVHGCTETATIEVRVVNVTCWASSNAKVQVCHSSTGGNNPQSLCISSNAVPAHMNNASHADCLGECGVTCVSVTAEKGFTVESNSTGDGLSVRVTPNPFNSVAVITIASVDDAKAQLGVYDAAGRRVAMLFEGNMDAGIGYEYVFDGSSLQPGVYIARLIGRDGSQASASMVIVK